MSPSTVSSSVHVLVVGSDPTLEEEFLLAFSEVRDVRGVVHSASTYRQALEAVRVREPQIVLVEIDRDTREIAEFSRAVHDLRPGVTITAVFRPDQLEQTASESGTIIELLRARVSDFLRRPLSTTELQAVLYRLSSAATAKTEAPAGAGRIVSFVSNKGGAGKSTMAVNVACELARRHPDEVLLVDTSLQLGTCAAMLDLSPSASVVDAARQSRRLDDTLLRQLTTPHSSSLRLLAAPAHALEAAEVDGESIALMLTIARRAFRFVVVDTFPILDNIVLATLDVSDLSFVLVQATAPSVAGAVRLLPVLEGLGFQAFRQRIVLNYNFRNFLGNLNPEDVAARLGRQLDYVVRYEKRALVSVNTGQPFILRASRWSRFGQTVRAMADDIAQGVRAAAPLGEHTASTSVAGEPAALEEVGQ